MKNILARITSLATAIMILALHFTTPVFALKEKTWDMYDTNYIYYYDPDGENCTPSYSNIGGDNKGVILNFSLFVKGKPKIFVF